MTRRKRSNDSNLVAKPAERDAWEVLTPEQIDEAIAVWVQDAPNWAKGLPFASIVDPLDKSNVKENADQ